VITGLRQWHQQKNTIRALDFENEYPIELPSHTTSGILGITSEAVFSLTDDPNVLLPEKRLDGMNQKKESNPKTRYCGILNSAA